MVLGGALFLIAVFYTLIISEIEIPCLGWDSTAGFVIGVGVRIGRLPSFSIGTYKRLANCSGYFVLFNI